MLTLLEETIARGYEPEDIAFLSHTNAAANEAITRVMKAGKAKKDCLWFRTSHSASNKLCGLTKAELWDDITQGGQDWVALREAGWACSKSFKFGACSDDLTASCG